MEQALKASPKASTTVDTQASIASLNQANTTLRLNNTRLTNALLTIQAQTQDFPEKITLAYILRNWRKIGEFIENLIILIRATLQK